MKPSQRILIVDWDHTMAPGVPHGMHFSQPCSLNPPYRDMELMVREHVDDGWRVCILTNRMNTAAFNAQAAIKSYFPDLDSLEVYTATAGRQIRTHGGFSHKEDVFNMILSSIDHSKESIIVHMEDDKFVLAMGKKNTEHLTCVYMPIHVAGR